MKLNVKRINGPWDLGYSLDKHVVKSVYLGDNEQGRPQFDTTRSEIGEALYKLKYKRDAKQVEVIAHQMTKSLAAKFKSASFIVPMAPSKIRSVQPVTEIAKAVASNMGVGCAEDLLIKKGRTPQIKDLPTKEERIAALVKVLKVQDVLPHGRHDLWLIDDLYDSGSSIEAACNVLREYGKVGKIFVATVTRTE